MSSEIERRLGKGEPLWRTTWVSMARSSRVGCCALAEKYLTCLACARCRACFELEFDSDRAHGAGYDADKTAECFFRGCERGFSHCLVDANCSDDR